MIHKIQPTIFSTLTENYGTDAGRQEREENQLNMQTSTNAEDADTFETLLGACMRNWLIGGIDRKTNSKYLFSSPPALSIARMFGDLPESTALQIFNI